MTDNKVVSERIDSLPPDWTGTVTAVEAQKRRQNRLSVFVDDQYLLGVAATVWADLRVPVGSEITVARIRQIQEAELLNRARAKAMRLIAFRPRSKHEIRSRLRREKVDVKNIERVIDSLVASGFLDDEEFARRYAESRIRSKGHGPFRVRSDLARLGVSRDVIDRTIESISGRAIEEAALKTARKYARRLRGETDERRRTVKMLQYLGRKGFSRSEARRICDLLDEPNST